MTDDKLDEIWYDMPYGKIFTYTDVAKLYEDKYDKPFMMSRTKLGIELSSWEYLHRGLIWLYNESYSGGVRHYAICEVKSLWE